MSSKIKFAVIGLGKIATTKFLPALFKSKDAELALVVTSDIGKASDNSIVAETRAAIMTYADFVDSDIKNIDAVYIALPNDMHKYWIKLCAQKQLHVLCEKPLTNDLDDALDCAAYCRSQGVLLAEAFMYRLDPRHEVVRNFISSGKIGHVSLFESHFFYSLRDLNNIRLKKDNLGGAIMDVGCYGIDAARYILGEEPLSVHSSSVIGAESGVDEVSVITLNFSSGKIAVVKAATSLTRYNNYRIWGDKGYIDVPFSFNLPPEHEPSLIVSDHNGKHEVINFPAFLAFDEEIRHFAHAVNKSDASLIYPLEQGVDNARVLSKIDFYN